MTKYEGRSGAIGQGREGPSSTGGGNGLEEDSQEDNSSGWVMLQK